MNLDILRSIWGACFYIPLKEVLLVFGELLDVDIWHGLGDGISKDKTLHVLGCTVPVCTGGQGSADIYHAGIAALNMVPN